MEKYLKLLFIGTDTDHFNLNLQFKVFAPIQGLIQKEKSDINCEKGAQISMFQTKKL